MEIAIYLFDGITALDAVGPYEVLQRLPGAEVKVQEIEGNPGYYSAHFHLRPHYQLEGVNVTLSLVSRLPSQRAA